MKSNQITGKGNKMSNQKDVVKKQSQPQEPKKEFQKNRPNTNRSAGRNRPDRERRMDNSGQQRPNNHTNSSSDDSVPQRSNPRRDRNRYPRVGINGADQQNESREHSERLRSRPIIDVAKVIKKRVETLEDISADIERIDSDIQFEIKQIQTTQLGL